MTEFKVGRSYTVNDIDNSVITVVKRTAQYIVITGKYNGRYYVYRQDLFRLGENIYIKAAIKNSFYFCFAGHELKN